jgi:hypothetical protein
MVKIDIGYSKPFTLAWRKSRYARPTTSDCADIEAEAAQ